MTQNTPTSSLSSLIPCTECKIPNRTQFTLLLNKKSQTYTLPLLLEERPELFYNIHTEYQLSNCSESNRFALLNDSLNKHLISGKLTNIKTLDENETYALLLIEAKNVVTKG
jgi:uncharacterized protein VirK/YbjX